MRYQELSLVFPALIDSGAEGNFIRAGGAKQLLIPAEPIHQSLRLSAVDGDPVGQGIIFHRTPHVSMTVSALHSEEIQFYAVILGLPWLRIHDPVISWSDNYLVFSLFS